MSKFATNSHVMTSDEKFHEIFWREIFHEIFRKIFLKYFKNFTMDCGCRLYIVHCNRVSKPVKGKYQLLCMNIIMYFLLTSYTLIMFLKVLSHFIMKIKNFMKYFEEGVLTYFKFSMRFLNISKWIFHRASLLRSHDTNTLKAIRCWSSMQMMQDSDAK